MTCNFKEDDNLDGEPLPAHGLDGVPMTEEDIDGVPSKNSCIGMYSLPCDDL